ncbi:MAG: hypothetical protein WC799_15135 [Desulfobacteraceae bacterium]|jgi:hypothetical protein
MKTDTIESRLIQRINRKRCNVFFADLGGYDQVGRALRLLVSKGRLVKIGQGIYNRAEASPFDGTPSPVKGIRVLAAEALGRLGVKTTPTLFEQAYNSGQTTQVPSGRVVTVNKRVHRKIWYNGIYVSFERG